jgi:hypothetical protein
MLRAGGLPATALEPIDTIRLLLYWPHSIRPHYRGEPVCKLKTAP